MTVSGTLPQALHQVFSLAAEPTFPAAQNGNWVQVPALLCTGCGALGRAAWSQPLTVSANQTITWECDAAFPHGVF